MAKVKIQGHASGTGIFTVTAPDSDTNRTITLPDGTGTLAFTTGDDDKLPLAGGTMTGDLVLNSSNITGTGDISITGGVTSTTGADLATSSGQVVVGAAGSTWATAQMAIANGTGAATSGYSALVIGNTNNPTASERGTGVLISSNNAAAGGTDFNDIYFAHRNNAGTGEGTFSRISSYKTSGADTTELRLYTTNTQRMTIDSIGNVGIGDTDPSEAKLSIDGVASGDYGLKIVQAQDKEGLYISQTGDNRGLYITSTSSTYYAAEIFGKSGLTCYSNASGGRAAYFYRNLAEAGSYPLVYMREYNASSTQPALKIQQDGAGYGIEIDQNGDNRALYIDSESTTHLAIEAYGKYGFFFQQDISGGYGAYFYRNVNEAGSNPLVRIREDRAANTQTALWVQQDGSGLCADFIGDKIRVADGILFGTDTADANALDDYEEGTWTPAFESNSAGSGRVTTVNAARYTKIGNVVHISAYIVLATLGTGGSGPIMIHGLPFTSVTEYGATITVGYALGFDTDIGAISGFRLQNADARIQLTGNDGSDVSPYQGIYWGTYAKQGMAIMFSGTFWAQ